jgi:hypothetical protein
MPLKLLVDTCVWLDLAQDYREQPVIAALEELTREGQIELLVPEQVSVEFARNKDRVIGKANEALQSHLRVVRQAVVRFADDASRDATLGVLAEVDRTAILRGEAVHDSLGRIEALLAAAATLPLTEAIKLRVVDRALRRLAPLHLGKLSIGDAILIEAFGDLLAEPADSSVQLGFVTHNYKDFGPENGDRRQPHGDLVGMFDGARSRYFTAMLQAVQWVAPDVLEDHNFEFNYSQEPKRLAEILEAEHLLFRQVWYNRHWNLRAQVESGEVKVITKAQFSKLKGYHPEVVVDEVWQRALAAAQRTEGEVGLDSLGPWDDFEWGMINGKLSALRWVMGDDWDMLDT